MSGSAADQLRRILHLIPRLADGEPHSLEEISRTAGATVETVRDDLVSLVTRFQEPGGFVEGVQLYLEPDRVALISNHFRRPMRLTISELCALELGLAMLRTERPPHDHPVIERARERLRDAMAKLPSDTLPAGESHLAAVGADIDPEHLAAARTALRGRRRMRLSYARADREAPDERVICPYALVAASGMFYIVAFCTRSDGLRIFRLDRVHEAAVLDDRFEIPDSFSLDRVLREGRAFHGEGAEPLRVRYSPRIARWIAEREGVPLDADGSLTLDHPMADESWAIRHVLQYGPEAQVLEPPRVRAAIRQRLARIATALGD